VTLTYLDASILILASRAQEGISRRALDLLDDPDRTFAASSYLKLEVIPQAAFHKRAEEVAFFERFFQGVSVWADENGLVDAALGEASTYGLHALDALHIVAAARTDAEFITVESPRKPMHRTKSIKVIFFE
jgi:predicted nucleic acid-binding protein